VKPWKFELYRGAKQPPPEHGIKIKKAGTTWWGERWIKALELVLRGDAGRLGRGRGYARAGRVHDLVVASGHVTAKVTGSRPAPYEVKVDLRAFAADTWSRALADMAAKAQFSAELLAGRMPPAIDDVFHAAGASLFPRERADLVTACSCPDSGDPCKHVAATHYVLGEALDRDPFLLFELRGKTKEQVLAALRDARNVPAAEAPAPKSRAKPKKPRVAPAATPAERGSPAKPARLPAEDYDKPRAALPALHFSFDEPTAHGAMLKQLGTPPGWHGSERLDETLGPLLRAASEAARRIARSEPTERETPSEATAKARARSRSSSATKRPNKRGSRAR
jgi:uncharacterized Zn finger protein